MLRNYESNMRLSKQGQRQCVKAPPVKTPAFGSYLHSQRLVKSYGPLKKMEILFILPYGANLQVD